MYPMTTWGPRETCLSATEDYTTLPSGSTTPSCHWVISLHKLYIWMAKRKQSFFFWDRLDYVHMRNVSKMYTVCFRDFFPFRQANRSSERHFSMEIFHIGQPDLISLEDLFSSLVQKINGKSLIPLMRKLFEIIFKTIYNYFRLFLDDK